MTALSSTVYELYDQYKNNFRKEYTVLISPHRTESNIQLRLDNFGKIQYRCDGHREQQSFNDNELLNLSNATVCLMPGQTPQQFLDGYFKFIQNIMELSNYKVRQIYQIIQDDFGQDEDDTRRDPDYVPRRSNKVVESETETESEPSEHEDDPDYIPSESEEEDSEYEDDIPPQVEFSEEEDDAESQTTTESFDDVDKDPDYVPSESDDDY